MNHRQAGKAYNYSPKKVKQFASVHHKWVYFLLELLFYKRRWTHSQTFEKETLNIENLIFYLKNHFLLYDRYVCICVICKQINC